MQDLGGLQPVFQNAGQQQMNQQMALAQQNQLVNQAGASQGGGMNPMAMAAMLRKKDGTEQSDAQKQEISKLGSNTYNPYSDYNRGTNGFGNYGE